MGGADRRYEAHGEGEAWAVGGGSATRRPAVDGHAIAAASRGLGPGVNVRGRGGRRHAPARWTSALLAVCALAAPLAARGAFMQAPAAKSVRTLVGCSPQVMMHPTMLTGSDESLVWSRVDENAGLPRNGKQLCGGGFRPVPGTGLQVCGSRHLSVRMTPEKAQAGQNFTTQLLWEYAVDASKQPQLHPGVPGDGAIAENATGTVTFVVAAPAPAFVALEDEPESYLMSVGCQGSVRLAARDAMEPVDLEVSGCSAATYAVDIAPIAAGSYPPSPTGLPQGVPLATGGVGGVPAVVALADSAGSRQVELQWTPERGQERSTPYRVCFKAEDVHGLKVCVCVCVCV